MSDITKRDVRTLEEGRDVLGRLAREVKAFADRLPYGESLRSKGRDAEAALQEAEAKLEALRAAIPDGDVRL